MPLVKILLLLALVVQIQLQVAADAGQRNGIGAPQCSHQRPQLLVRHASSGASCITHASCVPACASAICQADGKAARATEVSFRTALRALRSTYLLDQQQPDGHSRGAAICPSAPRGRGQAGRSRGPSAERRAPRVSRAPGARASGAVTGGRPVSLPPARHNTRRTRTVAHGVSCIPGSSRSLVCLPLRTSHERAFPRHSLSLIRPRPRCYPQH